MFNLDSYYPLPDSMYKCALSQSSHVDWQRFKERLAQTLIQRTPGQTLIRWVDWISVYAFDYVDEIRTTGSLATKTNASLMCLLCLNLSPPPRIPPPRMPIK